MSQVKDQGAVAVTKSQMVDRINDIAWQAHQGSVAAIIQILNERLVVSGVRTRAIFADGVLQLLCEAATVDQLEQSSLVAKIHEILESIAPRNIRRVNINSRIVREEQLLWLEEINRDRQNQLLWSQEITLSKPSIFQQLLQDLKNAYNQLAKPIPPRTQTLSTTHNTAKNPQKKLIIESVSLLTILILAALTDSRVRNFVTNWIPLTNLPLVTIENNPKSEVSSPKSTKSQDKSTNSTNDTPDDAFADAVRLANQATSSGKTATTKTQWLEIAAKWQRASDLMSKVPTSHNRYQEAQIRTKLYKEYSKSAEIEAEKR